MRRRAFSLAEVLVALLIIAMLAAAVYTFMWNVIADRERVDVYAARQIGATRLFSLIEGDLLTSVARSDTGGAGIRGDATSLAIFKRSVRLDSSGAGALGDATVSEYKYELGTDHVSARRDGGEFETLAVGIARVRLRYRHGDEWAEEFDSSAHGHVPNAVEIALWFGAPEPAREGKVATEEQDVEDTSDQEAMLPPPDRITVIAVPDAPHSAAQESTP